MINFEQPTSENPFGKILVTIDNYDRRLFQEPFTFQVINDVDKNIRWQTTGMKEGWWSVFVEPCNTEAIVKDYNGKILYNWKWETDKHGDKSHRVFLDWCQKNKGAKGIAIGTHDGTTGEWVVPVFSDLIEAHLIEASDKQYRDLARNYKNRANTIQELITANGSEIEFFEGDDTFTNSISKEHALKFNDEVRSVLKKSTSLNDLIVSCGLQNNLKWLHIDVEGIDDELILSLDDTRVKLPEIIIYESLNLSEERQKKVIKWLESKNYTCEESGWNTIATINKLDLSLLVHTCDSYEKYWGGMFYTLDFYWDYNQIPVYFSNEEKKMSDIIIDCKGIPYRPDSRIKQILTGKTDKNGFSDRFIKSVEQIQTKWILYIQEDMWLRRGIEKNLLKDLVDFAEKNNADAIKIHSKLFYYDEYKLEKTEDFVGGKRMLKYEEGENFLLTHNASIWRKDYILKHQRLGEDAWVNEIEGSKRMSSEPHHHYHYEMHWYCQPGISDKGEFSPEGNVYAHIVEEMKRMELEYNLREQYD
jgi:hypothetical protein